MNPPKKLPNSRIYFTRDQDWRTSLVNQMPIHKNNYIELDFIDLFLNCKDINFINQLSKEYNKNIIIIRSTNPKTIVSATSLGYKTELILEKQETSIDKETKNSTKEIKNNPQTIFHQGTLHSGEHLESDKDLFLIGDVNPGAMVSASGDVIVWGRLLGTAHAGKYGNTRAKISALQLRPVQLRIANKIARGPQEKPQTGFAEQAEIKSDMIVILPAKSH